MPMTRPAASKYLQHKWEAQQFREHRQRVKNAPSMLNMSAPKQYPHLKLGLNRIALQEETQSRYDRENQILLHKIEVIVNGNGRVDHWNQWCRRDLHAAARQKRQQEIDKENQSMLRRLQNTKPVIRRVHQKKDFEKHIAIKEMLEGSIKDYESPRARSENFDSQGDGRLSEHIQDASETSESKESSAHEQEAAIENNSLSFPTLPAGQKAKKQNKPPAENKQRNRNAAVPKLPAI
ncbi:C17orf105 [Bugula neritina]|uniref:C17orf105 n=1 Tax=Bugula neritina TaxID=10212 RepID=A0A7J7JKN2_BUGNE|nr:C17orf105 [Bugula neritina]